MGRRYYCSIFTILICSLVIFLVGCGISVRPRSYDVPPDDDGHYEESAYSSYYRSTPRTEVYHYDTSYDPWTMGTYYQHYSGSPRASGSSGSSSTSTDRVESKRPEVRGRDSASVNQSRAPSKEKASLKRNRSSIRERTERSSETNHSSITRQKARRETQRGKTNTTQRSQSNTGSHAKQRREQRQKARPKSTKSDDEDEEKKK